MPLAFTASEYVGCKHMEPDNFLDLFGVQGARIVHLLTLVLFVLFAYPPEIYFTRIHTGEIAVAPLSSSEMISSTILRQ